MELIYIWIEKFRNFKEVELNFSEKFTIKYDKNKESIKIKTNKFNIQIYPKHITNINAIVGKNGVGKTNLLDLLGIRTDDRNKNNAEYEIRYKNKKNFRLMSDKVEVEAEIKNSIYFYIYYMGKDNNGQDLFCFEGNDIESFQNIIENKYNLSIEYWRSKYWFAFVCNYNNEMLIHKYDLNEKIREGLYENDDNRSEQDKIVIVSLRENLNYKHYNSSSTKPHDDFKISVPRRIARFQSKLLAMKVEMLYKQLHKPNRLMFKDDHYKLILDYNSSFLTDGGQDEKKLAIDYSYKNLTGKDRELCKIFESFVKYYFNQGSLNIEEKEKIKKEISQINIKSMSLKGYKDYYSKVIQIISDSYPIDEYDKERTLKSFNDFVVELSKNKKLKISKGNIVVDITKKTNISQVLNLISLTIDEKIKSAFKEECTILGNFFSYTIENLSDGENAYLGFFASLYEQVSLLTNDKESYIILLDEPEVRMHPDLTRNFINELIFFLEDLRGSKKKFQIIISTHSPFILSDIQPNNIIYLEKNNEGYSQPIKRMINTFGANIHTLLKDGFFMSSTMGEFATSKIKEVISLITNTNIEDVTEEQKTEWLFIINSIGEPLIKNRIMKMFNDKFSLNYTDLYNENQILKGKLKKYEEPKKISETIEILKKQIENLQMNVSELEAKHNDKD